MIADAVLAIFAPFVEGFLSLLEGLWSVVDWTPLGPAWAKLWEFNDYAPVAELTAILGIVASVAGFMALARAVKWVVEIFPFKFS